MTFDWKNPERKGAGNQTGFIAQDVEKLFPKWVGEDTDGFKTLSIPQPQFAALTVEAFRAVNDRADKAEAELDDLKKELAEQKAVNADNSARIDAIERGHPRAPQGTIGFNPATGVGAFGIIVGGIAIFSSRKKKEEKAS